MTPQQRNAIESAAQLCALIAALGTAKSSDVALALGVTIHRANMRLQYVVRHGMASVNRDVYPYEYKTIDGWAGKVSDIRASLVPPAPVPRSPAAKRPAPASKAKPAKLPREDVYALRERHFDQPSATAHLHQVWGWVA